MVRGLHAQPLMALGSRPSSRALPMCCVRETGGVQVEYVVLTCLHPPGLFRMCYVSVYVCVRVSVSM
jgi:hypothetical protein